MRLGFLQLFFLGAYYFQLFYNDPSCINHFSRPTDTASLFMVGNLSLQLHTCTQDIYRACAACNLAVLLRHLRLGPREQL